MVARPENIENLIRSDALHEAERDQEVIDEHLKVAGDFLADQAKVASMDARFHLAYEGIHAIAMAVLNHLAARAGSADGHRSTALQVSVQYLEVESSLRGAFSTLSAIHNARNTKIYRDPLSRVSPSQVEAAVQLLETMHKLASAALVER